jgi:hypothetical protein
VLHAQDGAKDEHVDGLAWVPHTEGADGLQCGGVVVCEVADELLREKSRADGSPHQFGAVVVEAGSVPGSAVVARVDAVGDDLQLVGVEALLVELVADRFGARSVRTTKHLPVLRGEPSLLVEDLVDGGGGSHARAHRTRRAAVVCEGEVFDVLQVRMLERLDHEGVDRQAVKDRAQRTPLRNARQTLDDRARPIFVKK